MSESPHTSIITGQRPDDLPLMVQPRAIWEHVIRPQMFVALRRVMTTDLTLISLRIGAVEKVPFKQKSDDNASVHSYRLAGLKRPALQKKLMQSGFPVVTLAPIPSIALMPGCDVWLVLRNDTENPVQANGALVVQEEMP